jgi:hypothetical protein
MTQAAVATAAGTARECINRFERGTEALSPRTFYKMALSLNFSPAFLHGLATCPFNSDKLIKMVLPYTGSGIDYAMIHFLAEHCRRLELVFLWGRFRSRTNARSSEKHVLAIAARDNEGNVFLLKRKPDGPLLEASQLEQTAGKIDGEHNNRIVFGRLRVDFRNTRLAMKIAKWTAEKKDVECLFEVIEPASLPCPCSFMDMELVRMLREKSVSPAKVMEMVLEAL